MTPVFSMSSVGKLMFIEPSQSRSAPAPPEWDPYKASPYGRGVTEGDGEGFTDKSKFEAMQKPRAVRGASL